MNSLERRGSTYVIAGLLLWLVVHLACAFMGDVMLEAVLLGTIVATVGWGLCNHFVTWRRTPSRGSQIVAALGLLMWLAGWAVLLGGILSSPSTGWVTSSSAISVLGAVSVTLIFMGVLTIASPELYDVPVFWGFVLVCVALSTYLLSIVLPVWMGLLPKLPDGTVVETPIITALVSTIPTGVLVYFVHRRLSPPKDCDYDSNFDIVRGLSAIFLSTKGFVWGKIK